METLYGRYKNITQRKNSLEIKQFKLEQHIRSNPTDYTAIISNELIKSDIHREELLLIEIRKRMSLHEVV